MRFWYEEEEGGAGRAAWPLLNMWFVGDDGAFGMVSARLRITVNEEGKTMPCTLNRSVSMQVC